MIMNPTTCAPSLMSSVKNNMPVNTVIMELIISRCSSRLNSGHMYGCSHSYRRENPNNNTMDVSILAWIWLLPKNTLIMTMNILRNMLQNSQ